MLSNICYISQGNTPEEHFINCVDVLHTGCKMIQLRLKSTESEVIKNIAIKLLIESKKHNALFILNDDVMLAKEIEADGVHVGLQDMSVKEARNILGENTIIGATANTLDHILDHFKNGADYIGLGPFKFTTTKEKLSPILGTIGYQKILNELKNLMISIPIYAVGGITLNDIDQLKELGIKNVAVSGALTKNFNKEELYFNLNKKLISC